jgi:predicted metal-binding protein
MKNSHPDINSILDHLLMLAAQSGASRAGIIPVEAISAEEDLANLCRKPQCKNYGLAASCPPHVSGPPEFRKLLEKMLHAIVIRIDIPSSILFSDQRHDIMKLLHETAAKIEQSAFEMGFTHSKAFAGSSCKKIFCHEHAACQVISGNGKCRNPQSARPSMSGYGINVSKLMASAGWPSKITKQQGETDEDSMSWVAGLILIG